MSTHFSQSWAAERLLDFTLAFGAVSDECRELHESGVSASRIFKLYPLDMAAWVEPLRAALADEAVAKAIWMASNPFDTYKHILRHLTTSDDLSQSMVSKWNAKLYEKNASMAAKNAAWNLALYMTALDHLLNTADWQELYGDKPLMSNMEGFERVLGSVLAKATSV